ncbi:MAG TPA: site-specific DNA-methyltransferase, partial [Bacteroidetes bacterium]|nr:site-specific DNA-methyltransferase [Candidatus Limimorpha avicola]
EEGNQTIDPMQRNTESNGRFHTDWLNMIYPRLKVARDLLSDDGVIFISIDENEIENLKKVGNEIFGEHNFVGSVIWERAFAPKNDAKYFSDSHDYIVVYAKILSNFHIGKLARTEEANARYKNPDNDPRGPWSPDNMTVKTYSAAYDYEITTPNGSKMTPPNGRCWFTNKEKMMKLIADGRVWFGEDGGNMPRLKRYLADVQQGMTPTTIWKYTEVGHNQEGRQEVKILFDNNGYFDGPKPVRLLSRILQIANTQKDSIILDFFSGSATTAHAVMQLNAEDGGNRKFIMVQLPEKTDPKSEAYKAGYKNICEIGKERIRRAGRKIKDENKDKEGIEKLDTGFRVLKLDTSNMEDVYYTPQEFTMQSLFTENVKADRTGEDLLFQVMLDLGIELSAKIETRQIAGKTVHIVDDNYLVACFDRDVTEAAIKEIAQLYPVYFVMRDASAANDNVIDNFEQLFEAYSKDTVRKIL